MIDMLVQTAEVQAKPIRVLSVPLTSSQSNYISESSQSLSLFLCILTCDKAARLKAHHLPTKGR